MFYDIYERLCLEKGIKPGPAAEACGINRSNVSLWKSKGYTPRGEALQNLAEYFSVSTDFLLGKDAQEKMPALTKKDERDIAKDLENLRDVLEDEETLMFDGNPMTPEARESILAAMKLGLEAAKVKNKEKYTPKKYKGTDVG